MEILVHEGCETYVFSFSFAFGMANHSWHHKYSNDWDIQAYEKRTWSQEVTKEPLWSKIKIKNVGFEGLKTSVIVFNECFY